MSDNNDKKPNPVIPGWRSPETDGQSEQVQGHAMMDPLAELDRIVNEDLGRFESEQTGQGVISADDLRLLEQDLIRELQSQAPSQAAQNPIGEPGFAAAESTQSSFSQSVPPMPESAPVSAEVPPVDISPERPAPQAAEPDVRPSSAALDDWSRVFDDPGAAGAAPTPSISQNRMPPFGGASGDMDVAQSGRYGELSRAEPQNTVPSREMPVEVGGDVAAVARAAAEISALDRDVQSQSEAFAEKIAEPKADPMVGFSAGRGFVPPNDGLSQRTPDVAVPADPVSVDPHLHQQQPVDAEPEMSIDQLMAQLRGQAAPDVEPAPTTPDIAMSRQDSAARQVYQTAESQTHYQQQPDISQPVEPVAPVAPTSFVPGATEGLAPEQVNDPYAALNRVGMQAPEPSVQPSSYDDPAYGQAGQDPMRQARLGFGGAPAVNVAGEADPYVTDPYSAAPAVSTGSDMAVEAASYYPAGLETQSAESGYSPVQPGYPADGGQYGTYSDPNVALADAESRPYDPSVEYQGIQSEALEEAVPQTKTRKGFVVAIAALVVVGIGGGVIWGLSGSGGSDSETPVIVANNDPVKETPDDPGGKVIPHQNKEIYDRIDGTRSDEGPENLMPATEKPMALTNDGNSPRVISLSGGEEVVNQNGGAQAPASARAPKKVRTVIVRPDGTIVTANEADTRSTAPQSPGLESTPSEDALSQTLAAGTQNPLPTGTDTTSNGLVSASDGLATNILPQSKPAELVALQAAAREAAEAARQAAVQAAPAPSLQEQTPSAAPRSQVQGQQPLVLAPNANNNVVSQQPAQQATAGGAYTVQVTSQRSPEQARAAFSNIQSRLPSVLGGYQPDIKRADLGDRGIYYRVRVGSFADQAGAGAFCQSIKQAGGDCLVSRR